MSQVLKQIRRERLSRRVIDGVKQADDVPRVLVGNLIGEGHVNYILMYNMLTGIRIAVSRTRAKALAYDDLSMPALKASDLSAGRWS